MMGSKATVQQRLEALRAEGHPTSMAELDERCQLPETAQNAADLYRRAFAAFVTLVERTDIPLFARDALPERGAPLPDEMATAISQYLATNRDRGYILYSVVTDSQGSDNEAIAGDSCNWCFTVAR
ncbi:MAG: hypothetical protein KBE65_17185 [Phycisphaerae bacterium]|nr:hypothetical protein [Phycisphaerae bacterium]